MKKFGLVVMILSALLFVGCEEEKGVDVGIQPGPEEITTAVVGEEIESVVESVYGGSEESIGEESEDVAEFTISDSYEDETWGFVNQGYELLSKAESEVVADLNKELQGVVDPAIENGTFVDPLLREVDVSKVKTLRKDGTVVVETENGLSEFVEGTVLFVPFSNEWRKEGIVVKDGWPAVDPVPFGEKLFEIEVEAVKLIPGLYVTSIGVDKYPDYAADLFDGADYEFLVETTEKFKEGVELLKTWKENGWDQELIPEIRELMSVYDSFSNGPGTRAFSLNMYRVCLSVKLCLVPMNVFVEEGFVEGSGTPTLYQRIEENLDALIAVSEKLDALVKTLEV
jgi:hypothetical protein